MASETSLELYPELERGKCYELCFTLDYGGSGQVNIYAGDTIDDTAGATLIGTANADGSFNFDFDFPASGGEEFTYLIIEDTGTPESQISDLSIRLDVECADQVCTECLVKDECNEPCELPLLEWWNDDNGFGMEYENMVLRHSLYVWGGLRARKGNYPEDEVFTFSNGETKRLYAQVQKTYDLYLHDLPEYLHEAIMVALMHDHFQITVNGKTTEFIKSPGEYSPDYDIPESLFAGIIIPLYEKTQDLYNRNCV